MKRTIGETRRLIMLVILNGYANGKPPTLREICDAVEVSHSNVQQHLDRMKREKLVTWEPHKKRTLVPLVKFIPAEELL